MCGPLYSYRSASGLGRAAFARRCRELLAVSKRVREQDRILIVDDACTTARPSRGRSPRQADRARLRGARCSCDSNGHRRQRRKREGGACLVLVLRLAPFWRSPISTASGVSVGHAAGNPAPRLPRSRGMQHRWPPLCAAAQLPLVGRQSFSEGNKWATDETESRRARTNSSPGIEPNPEPRRAPPNSPRGLRNRRSLVRVQSGAPWLLLIVSMKKDRLSSGGRWLGLDPLSASGVGSGAHVSMASSGGGSGGIGCFALGRKSKRAVRPPDEKRRLWERTPRCE